MEYDYGVLEYSRVLVEYDTNTSGDKVVYLPLCVQLSAPLTGFVLFEVGCRRVAHITAASGGSRCSYPTFEPVKTPIYPPIRPPTARH